MLSSKGSWGTCMPQGLTTFLPCAFTAHGLQKIAVTRTTVQLAPWATIWMAVGAEVAKAQPASILAAFMRAKVHRGIDGTRASVGRGHRSGSPGRRCFGMMRVMCTRGAMRALRKPLKRFGVVRAFTFEPGGPGCAWQLRVNGVSAGPDIVQYDA